MEDTVLEKVNEIKQLGRIKSIAWDVHLDAEYSDCDTWEIRVEDESGKVVKIYVPTIREDGCGRIGHDEACVIVCMLFKKLKVQGVVDKEPWLLDFYNHLYEKVNEIRGVLPYTGEEWLQVYEDGTRINPWIQPEHIY